MIFNLPNLAGVFLFFSGCLFLYLIIREENAAVRLPEPGGEEPFRCPICTYLYPADKGAEFSTCPRCGTINKQEDA